VKTNIGHLEPAAGVASLTKVLKAFEHKILPPNIHFERLNPGIVLEGSPFRPLIETVSWGGEKRRVAGISSFGFGGTNAHVVLSEPPERLTFKKGVCPEVHVIVVSARSLNAFLRNVRTLAAWVGERLSHFTPHDMVDLAFTLSCRRTHFSYRQAWIVSNVEALLQALSSCSESVRSARDDRNAPIVKGERCLETLRKQYLEGYTIDWAPLYEGMGAQAIRLPTYRFEEKPFWFQ
jgi:acyl transferase domain-containing protein